MTDTELQAWIGDLHDNGYPARGAENSHWLPFLCDKLGNSWPTSLPWLSSRAQAKHAAVNFSQLDAYGFQPHYSQPHATTTSQNKRSGERGTHIMNILPTGLQTGVTVTVVFDLTRKFDDEPTSWTVFSGKAFH
ncbi:hypothetical protein OS493_035690 [Desmophyllum pertusum]|uniref:Lipoxygenase domain-containing protein n=1 Tax=Desmophyllum pertusum TaxID=174260 RepID=A0A9W9YLG6_9CNID|nr:hypothetical protein OS493_035690 [Desmophyllum pertusum]